MTAAVSSDPELVQAILDDRLSIWAREVLDDPESADGLRTVATQAAATCVAIGAAGESEGERLASALRSAGVEATIEVSDQRHSIRIDVEPEHPELAMSVLRDAGYELGHEWVGAAARSFRRFADGTTLTRSGTHSTVVRLRWKQPTSTRSTLRSTIRRIVTPTPADWAMVDLPVPLWWTYGIIRPFRLVAERLGLASADHGDLEPFLVTPDGLLEPLFDMADVKGSDVFADIGCGDGRLVVAAARHRGCRAIGVEQSARSVAVARERVDVAGLSDRVQIVHGDAQDADVSDVTVALCFLPMVVAVRVVPTVLQRLPAGGRVVLHEQSRLPTALPSPDRSVAIVADDAVTVAHRWDR